MRAAGVRKRLDRLSRLTPVAKPRRPKVATGLVAPEEPPCAARIARVPQAHTAPQAANVHPWMALTPARAQQDPRDVECEQRDERRHHGPVRRCHECEVN